MEEEYTALTCPNCGGEVKVDQQTLDEHYLEIDGKTFAYMGTITDGKGATCLHCGTKFVRKQKLDIHFEGKGNLEVNTGGGAFIGGNIILKDGGDFVGRDKTITVIQKMGNVSGTVTGLRIDNLRL